MIYCLRLFINIFNSFLKYFLWCLARVEKLVLLPLSLLCSCFQLHQHFLNVSVINITLPCLDYHQIIMSLNSL